MYSAAAALPYSTRNFVAEDQIHGQNDAHMWGLCRDHDFAALSMQSCRFVAMKLGDSGRIARASADDCTHERRITRRYSRRPKLAEREKESLS